MPTAIRKKLPITIIILIHRVDERLEKAINSVSFAEQIMLVDQGGKTNTTDLEKKFQFDKVVLPEQPSDNFNFAELRNQSLNYAKYECVFFLDSDEVVTKNSYPEIVNLLQDQSFNAAFIKRRDIFYGKELNWGEVRQQSLLRIGRKKSLKFLRPVHEVGSEINGVIHSNITVLHYSHNSISDFIDKVAFYAKIDAHHRQKFHQNFELWELVLLPVAKFIYNYLILLGLLDGWRGFVYAAVMSLHSLFVRVYVYQIEQSKQMS